jgi:hypothetical protein
MSSVVDMAAAETEPGDSQATPVDEVAHSFRPIELIS